ncbi:hypothetical protein [Morganella morganii]|uniref:hypothetical protein n=1 Tax=Morganella morganii TaxID=582 RepID=UPI001BD98DDC|nr:hypothetical protein [Morganella morganii]MBT0306463.1 hypothetical protein [Morganella morganii subsp. morganii]
MSTESLLSTMLEYDFFYNQDSMVSGIAQRAIDNGFNTLSEAQKRVLNPFLTKPCEGVTNPGGHHNNCQKPLSGDELEIAIRNESYYGNLLCENCINETEDYRREWENIEAQ